MIASLRRIYALILRQIYMNNTSLPRFLTTIFWPTLQLLTWGYFNKYLLLHSPVASMTLSTLLGASLFLVLFERSNVQVMWGFLEDYWARNLGNIVITPISGMEMLIGYLLAGFMGMAIGMAGASLISYWLFDYSIFKLGIYALLLSVNLTLSGWCMGMLLIALILRYGTNGEFVGWMLASVLVPFIAVYYPVSVLPVAAQYMAWALPPTYMFEALRELIDGAAFNWSYFYKALALNGVYFVISALVYFRQLQKARQRGGLFSSFEG